MKFEIRRVQNGAVLRVEPDHPDAEAEEVVYQETETDEIEAFAERGWPAATLTARSTTLRPWQARGQTRSHCWKTPRSLTKCSAARNCSSR